MKYLLLVTIVLFIWKPVYPIHKETDPLAIKVNAMLKAEGYRLPHEFRSYLPTCNYWPLDYKE